MVISHWALVIGKEAEERGGEKRMVVGHWSLVISKETEKKG